MANPPDEAFSLLAPARPLHPRLGCLTLPGRSPMLTPNYIGSTSRGTIPHISQDNFANLTSMGGVYVPLEDFLERIPSNTPPLYNLPVPPDTSRLRRFIALPSQSICVTGPRRTSPVAVPEQSSNTSTSITVCTGVGFKTLEADAYAVGVEKLGADITLALADVPHGRALGWKRVEKATERSERWLREHVALRKEGEEESLGKLFAALLPVSCAKQTDYVECLQEDEVLEELAGLAIHSLDTLEDLPSKLTALPRLAFTEPATPHGLLRQISLGLDVLTLPFVHTATDAGIALDFVFPAPSSEPLQPLGIDMWSPMRATDLSPLKEGCKCYACTEHHRAFVQHLLSAKEMLAWTLLQVHNHHILQQFFAGVRESISRGTWEDDVRAFGLAYEPLLPVGSGAGPRVRGYQFKTEGPKEAKKNKKAFQIYQHGSTDDAKVAVVPAENVNEPPGPDDSNADADTFDLEGKGLADLQL